jgi:hypothetical protein
LVITMNRIAVSSCQGAYSPTRRTAIGPLDTLPEVFPPTRYAALGGAGVRERGPGTARASRRSNATDSQRARTRPIRGHGFRIGDCLPIGCT